MSELAPLRRSVVCLLAAVILFGLDASGRRCGAAATAWNSDDQTQARSLGTRPADENSGPQAVVAPAVVLVVPRAITPEELERYAAILMLSPEQRRVLDEAFETYLGKWAELAREQLPRVAMLSRTAADTLQAEGYTRSAVAAFELFYNVEQSIAEQQAKLEAELIASLVPVLADEQASRIERVKLHRERSRSRAHSPINRSAATDLSWLAERFLGDLPVSAELDGILIEYEQAVTPRMAEVFAATRHISRRVEAMLHKLFFDEHENSRETYTPEHNQRVRVYVAEKQRLLAFSAELQAQIVHLNRLFIDRIAKALPPELQPDFLQAYREQAYPTVYPDVLNPTPWHSKMSALVKDDAELQSALAVIWDIYERSYEQLSKEMEEACDRWNEELARSLLSDGYAAYQEKQRDLRVRRWKASLKALEQVHSMLPAEAQIEAGSIMKEYRRRFAQFTGLAEAGQLRQ